MFREFRGHLMNVAEDYDDNVERRNIHPLLLPAKEKISSNVSETLKQIVRPVPVQDSKTMSPVAKKQQDIVPRTKTMIKQTRTLLEHCRSVLSKHKARAMRKSSGHSEKCPERSKYPALMTYLAGEADPAKRRAAGRLRARALGYRYPTNVKQMMARQ